MTTEQPSSPFAAGAGMDRGRELTAQEQAEFARRRLISRITFGAVLLLVPAVIGALVWGQSLDKEQTITKYYPGGKARTVAEYKAAILHGHFTEYWENGQTKAKGAYAEGMKHGPWQMFDSKGRKTESGRYKADRQVGAWKTFHKNGAVESEIEYDGRGLRTGVGRFFYSSGEKRGEQPYQEGLVHGTERIWYDNGQLQAETVYVSGYEHGRHRAWHKNGQLGVEGSYAGGFKAGVWKTWDEDGALLSAYDHDLGGEVVTAPDDGAETARPH